MHFVAKLDSREFVGKRDVFDTGRTRAWLSRAISRLGSCGRAALSGWSVGPRSALLPRTLGCRKLLSVDPSHGRKVEEITITNLFL